MIKTQFSVIFCDESKTLIGSTTTGKDQASWKKFDRRQLQVIYDKLFFQIHLHNLKLKKHDKV